MKEIALLLYNLTDVNVHLFNKEGALLFSTEENPLSDMLQSERASLLRHHTKELESISTEKILNFQYTNYQNFLYYSNEKINLLWGPFLSSPPNTEIMDKVQAFYKNSGISIHEIVHYYRSMVILGSRKISAAASTILSLTTGRMIYGDNLMNMSLTHESPELPEMLLHSAENQNDASLIVERYNNESLFMQAVSRGDKKSAYEILGKSANYMSLKDRVKGDPLRSILDLSITFNTILRIAARQGGVHPRQLHYLSEKFAILIETKKTLNDTHRLRKQMMEEYCDAVKKYGTHNYSHIVRKAIMYIQTNLDEDLSLAAVSAELSVNPSYLSRLFKNETNETFSGYVNTQRINNASYMLSYTNLSIADIAAQTGYNDTAYFCRIFKKVKGLSPSRYRETELSF